MYLADNLQYLRTMKKMTQTELAKSIGISRSALSLYEIEKREPDIETIVKIARFFEVSLDDLILKKLRPETSLLVRNIKFLQEKYGISDRDITLISAISATSSKTVKGMLKSLAEWQEGVEIANYFAVPAEEIYSMDLSKEIDTREVLDFISKKFLGHSEGEMRQIIEKYLSERS